MKPLDIEGKVKGSTSSSASFNTASFKIKPPSPSGTTAFDTSLLSDDDALAKKGCTLNPNADPEDDALEVEGLEVVDILLIVWDGIFELFTPNDNCPCLRNCCTELPGLFPVFLKHPRACFSLISG